MLDKSRYIVDGKVKRDRIVADIKRGRIDKNDIMELDKIPEVREEYFEGEKLRKIDKSSWNNKYLDELSLVSVSESFGKEYLLYLSDVAEYVITSEKKKENTNKLIKGLLIIAVIMLLIILAIAFLGSKTKKETVSVASVQLTQNTYLCLVKVLN